MKARGYSLVACQSALHGRNLLFSALHRPWWNTRPESNWRKHQACIHWIRHRRFPSEPNRKPNRGRINLRCCSCLASTQWLYSQIKMNRAFVASFDWHAQDKLGIATICGRQTLMNHLVYTEFDTKYVAWKCQFIYIRTWLYYSNRLFISSDGTRYEWRRSYQEPTAYDVNSVPLAMFSISDVTEKAFLDTWYTNCQVSMRTRGNAWSAILIYFCGSIFNQKHLSWPCLCLPTILLRQRPITTRSFACAVRESLVR